MKQYHIVVLFSLLIIISFLADSCAPNLSLSIIIPETRLEKARQIYLISTEEFNSLQEIITRNDQYFHKKMKTVTDSLNVMRKDYNKMVREYQIISEQCSTLQRNLPVQYCKEIEIEPVQIAKYGDMWRIKSHIINLGDEDIWGLFLSVRFKNQYIVKQTEFPMFIPPKQRFLYHQISIDLSNNIPLQYSMATHPGGLNTLLQEALIIEVDSVISNFTDAMSDCLAKQTELKHRMEAKSIEMELYKENISEYLYQTAINPINRIISENLRHINQQTSVSSPDTIVFENLKKENYQLFSYINIDSSADHYLIPVDLSTPGTSTINIKNYQPSTLFLNRDKFLGRLNQLTDN